MKFTETNRGFKESKFVDLNGVICSLQESSLATESAIWFGADEIGLERFEDGEGWKDVKLEQDHENGIAHIANNRMHLAQSDVVRLLPALQYFAQFGKLPNTPLDSARDEIFNIKMPLQKRTFEMV